MQNIVAVLNDFEKADAVLQKAIMLSEEHDCLLEVLYVHEKSLFDLPDYFRRDGEIENSVDKEKVKNEIKDRVLKFGYTKECAVFVYIDDTVDRVLELTKEYNDVLVVVDYDEKMTKKLLKDVLLPILVVKNDKTEYKKIVLPVDLSENTKRCVELAKKVFPKANKHLLYDYRYVVDVSIMDVDYLGMPTTEPIMNTEINQELKHAQLEKFEALKKETGFEGDFIEELETVEADLSRFINVCHFDLTVLCSNEKHFLSLDSHSLQLLEMLSTDILYRCV